MSNHGRLHEVLMEVSRYAAHQALLDHNGNKRAAARELGISTTTLYGLLAADRKKEEGSDDRVTMTPDEAWKLLREMRREIADYRKKKAQAGGRDTPVHHDDGG